MKAAILQVALFSLIGCTQPNSDKPKVEKPDSTSNSTHSSVRDSAKDTSTLFDALNKYSPPSLYAFCEIDYQYKIMTGDHQEKKQVLEPDGLGGYYLKEKYVMVPGKDSIIYKSTISDIKQIENSEDEKYRFLDEIERISRGKYIGDFAYQLIDRHIYTFYTYAKASTERQLFVRRISPMR